MAPGAGPYGTDVICQSDLAGNPIRVFNHGQMQRDFTYIDDIVEGATDPRGHREPRL